MNDKNMLKIKKRLLLYLTVIITGISVSECSSDTNNQEKENIKVLRKEDCYER